MSLMHGNGNSLEPLTRALQILESYEACFQAEIVEFEPTNPHTNRVDSFSAAKALWAAGGRSQEVSRLLEAAIKRGGMREEELQETWELLAAFRRMGGWPRSSRNALVMAVRLALQLGKANANDLLTVATCYAYTSPPDPHRAKLLVHLWLEIRNPKLATEIQSAGLLSITEILDAKCDASLLVALAVLFHIDGNYEKAANCFESTVHIIPGNPVLLEYFGRSLRTVGALVKSLGAYRCALRLEPESCSARYGIACIYWDMGFRELSVRWLVDAIRLRGNSFWRSDDQICQTLSGCFERMGCRDLVSAAVEGDPPVLIRNGSKPFISQAGDPTLIKISQMNHNVVKHLMTPSPVDGLPVDSCPPWLRVTAYPCFSTSIIISLVYCFLLCYVHLII